MSVSIPGWLTTALSGGGLDLVEVWADLYQGGSKVATVDIIDGSVKAAWGQDITSTVDLTVAGWDGFLPETPVVGTNRLYGEGTYGSGIYGDYVHTEYKSLALPVKTTAVVSWKATAGANTATLTLGTFTVTAVSWADEPDGPRMKLSGADATWDLSRLRWLAPFQVAAGTALETAIEDIVGEYLPGTTVTITGTTYTTPLLTYLPGAGSDVWRACADIAYAAGLELYANRAGDLVGVPREDDDEALPVWTITDTGTGMRFVQTPDAEEMCNTVLAFGESGGETPVYGVAQDTSGPFGTVAVGRAVVREYRSAAITTSAQALNAANSLLRKWSSVSETVEVETAPVPHIDPGDYVRVVSAGLELDDTFRVVSVDMPFDVETSWRLTVRRRIA